MLKSAFALLRRPCGAGSDVIQGCYDTRQIAQAAARSPDEAWRQDGWVQYIPTKPPLVLRSDEEASTRTEAEVGIMDDQFAAQATDREVAHRAPIATVTELQLFNPPTQQAWLPPKTPRSTLARVMRAVTPHSRTVSDASRATHHDHLGQLSETRASLPQTHARSLGTALVSLLPCSRRVAACSPSTEAPTPPCATTRHFPLTGVAVDSGRAHQHSGSNPLSGVMVAQSVVPEGEGTVVLSVRRRSMDGSVTSPLRLPDLESSSSLSDDDSDSDSSMQTCSSARSYARSDVSTGSAWGYGATRSSQHAIHNAAQAERLREAHAQNEARGRVYRAPCRSTSRTPRPSRSPSSYSVYGASQSPASRTRPRAVSRTPRAICRTPMSAGARTPRPGCRTPASTGGNRRGRTHARITGSRWGWDTDELDDLPQPVSPAISITYSRRSKAVVSESPSLARSMFSRCSTSTPRRRRLSSMKLAHTPHGMDAQTTTQLPYWEMQGRSPTQCVTSYSRPECPTPLSTRSSRSLARFSDFDWANDSVSDIGDDSMSDEEATGAALEYASHYSAQTSAFEFLGAWTQCDMENAHAAASGCKQHRVHAATSHDTGAGFSELWVARNRDTEMLYMAKAYDKLALAGANRDTWRKAMESIRVERQILEGPKTPFLMSALTSMQDDRCLYVILDVSAGESLGACLAKQGKLSEGASCFFMAEVVEAVGHLHSRGIVHRALSPEAVLLDGNGHICLTDFAAAKDQVHNATGVCFTVCGKDPYSAPEVQLGARGHGLAVDWWSLGIIMYKMLTGKVPLPTVMIPDLDETIEAVLRGVPEYVGPRSQAFMESLMQINPARRLGSSRRGAQDVKDHAIFAHLDWSTVTSRAYQSPYAPGPSTKFLHSAARACQLH
eukprot:TRINITY_DN18994_c0_g1_i1.p1 TRINITY_DN18994_c0_g1~~TRINITY_DN18994_c0_g1_i1.p1  ORF type:complete len:896 (-),score=107.08 TRINITY_DN18994_c0_g1_i1:129-2816(-)